MRVVRDAHFEWLNIRHGLFIYFKNTNRLIESFDKPKGHYLAVGILCVLGGIAQEGICRIMPMKCEALVGYNLINYYAFITGYGFEMDSINNVNTLRYLLDREDILYTPLGPHINGRDSEEYIMRQT